MATVMNLKGVRVTLIAAGTLAVLASSAGAAPAAVDIQVDIAVREGAVSSGIQAPVIANGGTVTVRGRNFAAGPVISLINPEAASAKVRFELPPGLSWGADLPDPTESCTSTPSTGDCQSPSLQPITGQGDWGWIWDIVAAQTGTYVLRAEILETTPPDAQPANNTSSVTVVVTDPTVGGGTGGASVSAGAVKLAPAKPKAGSTVRATVRVTAGGTPLKPTAVACKGTIGASKLKGTGKAASGTATCLYRTPKAAKGKTLRGTMSFTARGKRFTKRFSTKLG